MSTGWDAGWTPTPPLYLEPSPWPGLTPLIEVPVEAGPLWWRIDSATLTLVFDALDGDYYGDLVSIDLLGSRGNILHVGASVGGAYQQVDHLATPFVLGNALGLALSQSGGSSFGSVLGLNVSLSTITFP